MEMGIGLFPWFNKCLIRAKICNLVPCFFCLGEKAIALLSWVVCFMCLISSEQNCTFLFSCYNAIYMFGLLLY